MQIYKEIIEDFEVFNDGFTVTEVGDLFEAEYQFEEREVLDVFGTRLETFSQVRSLGLQDAELGKGDFLRCMKSYHKAVLAKLEHTNPERVDSFKKAAAALNKMIWEDFESYKFYTSHWPELVENMSYPYVLIPMRYREDGTTPYLIFFKDAVTVEEWSGTAPV
ncbi:translationally-controlled tumor protein [Streptomyces albus]|nr:translationally-controlled tumor protein [Streptomyces albus]